MSGSKVTTMTAEQMRRALANRKDKTDWARLRCEVAQDIEPTDDLDSPDASALIQKEVMKRKAGRPAGSGKKEPVALRLDRDVVQGFRAMGPGWQTRMNKILRDWLKKHPATAR